MEYEIQNRTEFPAPTIFCGKMGTGKSTRLKRMAEDEHNAGNCVIDLCDWGRFENACYAIPNYHSGLYDKFNYIITSWDKKAEPVSFKAKYFPVTVYVPAVKGIQKTLPNFFQPFRIIFQELTFHEFIILCGFSGNETAVEILELSWSSKKKHDTFEDYVKRTIRMAGYGSLIVKVGDESSFEVNTAERRSFAPLLRKLRALWDSGLICDEGDELALRIDDIMRDKSKIHSFSTAYIEDVRIPFLIYGFLLRRIFSLRLKQAEKYPNLAVCIREVQKIAPNWAEFEGQNISRSNLRAIIRECRDLKLWLYMDTQDPRDLDRSLLSKIYTWYIFNSDKVVVDWLGKYFWIPDSVANAIPRLTIGMCCTKFKTIHVPTIYPPPLSLVKAYDEQFVVVWEKLKGGYKDWNIEFVDTDDIISFTIPEKAPKEKLSKREKNWVRKYIATWMRYVEKHGNTSLNELCELVDITKPAFYEHIKDHEEFLKFLDYSNGIVSKKQ